MNCEILKPNIWARFAKGESVQFDLKTIFRCQIVIDQSGYCLDSVQGNTFASEPGFV